MSGDWYHVSAFSGIILKRKSVPEPHILSIHMNRRLTALLELTASCIIPSAQAFVQVRDALSGFETLWFKERMTLNSLGSFTPSDLLESSDDSWLKSSGQHAVLFFASLLYFYTKIYARPGYLRGKV